MLQSTPVPLISLPPLLPEGPLVFNTPEWYETVRFAAQEAKRLGLELGMANCSGWANSGGPWNTPEHAMKTVCFTATPVAGGARFEGALPQPKDEVGFYRDIAVVAFPTPAEAFELKDWTFKCFSNPGRKYDVPDARVAPEGAVVRRAAVVDLTSRMKDGRLVWDAPAGAWTVLRVGYMIPATKGQVLYNGEDILTYDKKKMWEMRRKLQIIFQDPYSSLNPRMTVYDLISAPLEVYKIGTKEERREMVEEILQDTLFFRPCSVESKPSLAKSFRQL